MSTHQAVILAAGNGSRIQRFQDDLPKPLHRVGGLSLIQRSILTAKLAGIREVIVIVGYKREEIIRAITSDDSLGVKIQFVENPDWKKSNGLSLLKARPYIKGQFLLLMADHIFDRRAIEKIRKTNLETTIALGIDRNLQEIFDLDDATKVVVEQDRVVRIGKALSSYNALDTGVFLCSHAFFDTLEQIVSEKGDSSLSEGVQALAHQKEVGVCDLTGFAWQDVDTPASLKQAEKMLFGNLKKPTDGWIAQKINRRISIPISKLLLKTHLSANHVTGLVTLIGVLSGFFVAGGRYWEVALGGILFNLASILDGCDGEISKLKLSYSKLGEWLDTISDNITYLSFISGIIFGLHRQGHSPHLFLESLLTLAGLACTLTLLFFYLVRYTNSGSLVTFQKEMTREEKEFGPKKGGASLLLKMKFMIKRDFFALLFMVLALFNQIQLILHLCFLGANLAWIVILLYKKHLFKLGPARTAQTHR